MAGKCLDHDKVLETLVRNTSAIEHAQATAEQRHQEYREDMRELKQLLRPPAQSSSSGIHLTNTQGTASTAPGGDWNKLWVSILLIALVVVGALFVKLGFSGTALASPPAASQDK